MKKIRKYFRHLTPQQFVVLLLPIGLLLGMGILFVSGRNFLAQRPCGCGQTNGSNGEFNSQETTAYWDSQIVGYPFSDLLALSQHQEKYLPVLGETNDERWIEVNLTEQKLYAHQGNQIVYEFLISSGKPWTPTVTGEFRVWGKFRYAKMSGGSKEQGNYYYLPNVPFIQYFYKDYGLHGAYWHNNFGHTMSHGCVNLSIPDSEKLFYWTTPVMPEGKNYIKATEDNPGTRVLVHK